MIAGFAMRAVKEFNRAVDQLLAMLVEFGAGNDVLANPWVDQVEGLDLPDAPARRIANLRAYLHLHRNAKWMAVGQEAGYAGCRFSGLPFTGEDLLEGPRALSIFAGSGVKRTSVFEKPISERSANFSPGPPSCGHSSTPLGAPSHAIHVVQRPGSLPARSWQRLTLPDGSRIPSPRPPRRASSSAR